VPEANYERIVIDLIRMIKCFELKSKETMNYYLSDLLYFIYNSLAPVKKEKCNFKQLDSLILLIFR
jgi:hypothetical protein